MRSKKVRFLLSTGLVALALLASGCGYRPLTASQGPLAGLPAVVAGVEPARSLDAGLASAIAHALPLELARAGVPLADPGSDDAATIHIFLAPVTDVPTAHPLAPDGFEGPTATGRTPGLFALEARLRVRIVAPDGRSLWEGSVTARAEYAEPAALADRPAGRERAERDLAAALAVRVREILVR